MRYVSIFSGIEAASVAWESLWWEPVCFSEIDPFPSSVLAERYPDVPNLGDITKINWKKVKKQYGPVDLVVGGSPCQSFSIAGTRTGLDGESGLMWEYVRCVRELMPRWLLWENVPGALSSSHGQDFRCLLESLDACGYGLAWRVLDAQFFGLAQRRERLFVVGSLGDGGAERACSVLFEPESLSWDSQTSREKRQELAARAGRGSSRSGGALNPSDPQSKRVFDPSGVAPTLSSGTGEGMNIQPSVLCAGFKWHQGSGAGSIGLEDEQSPTLTADYHNPAVLCMAGQMPNSMISDEICGTLTAHEARGGVDRMSEAIVRRLTPRECERLMGFPDDWTRIPYRGKSANDCPDSPRYKAIGNSMAVPVMRWIGQRIQKVEESN